MNTSVDIHVYSEQQVENSLVLCTTDCGVRVATGQLHVPEDQQNSKSKTRNLLKMLDTAVFTDVDQNIALLPRSRISYINCPNRIKYGLVALGLVIYVILTIVKSYYQRRESIEELHQMVKETQKQIMRLYILDHQLAVQIQQTKDMLHYPS